MTRTAADGDPHLRGVRVLARLLDDAIRIPGTRVRVGLDPILGLVPGAGDLLGGVLSGYVILVAARLVASRSVLLRMLGNIAIDTLVGSVPALGDLFDAGFKANARNVALLERHLARPADTERASGGFVALVLLVALLLAAGVFVFGVLMAKWIWHATGR